MQKRQRTIDSMKPMAASKARRLWNLMHDYYLLDDADPEFRQVRANYHAMFRDDKNFMPNTAPYYSPDY